MPDHTEPEYSPGSPPVLDQHAKKRETDIKYKYQPQEPAHTDNRNATGIRKKSEH